MSAFTVRCGPGAVWGPVSSQSALAADPAFVPDQTPGRDAVNIVVGTGLAIDAWWYWPICLVMQPVVKASGLQLHSGAA